MLTDDSYKIWSEPCHRDLRLEEDSQKHFARHGGAKKLDVLASTN
jgi:hypothetical protein